MVHKVDFEFNYCGYKVPPPIDKTAQTRIPAELEPIAARLPRLNSNRGLFTDELCELLLSQNSGPMGNAHCLCPELRGRVCPIYERHIGRIDHTEMLRGLQAYAEAHDAVYPHGSTDTTV